MLKEVNQKNSDKVFENLYGYDKNIGSENQIKIKFKKGDYVRITKYKSIFSKGYERNWNQEVFEIDKVLLNNFNHCLNFHYLKIPSLNSKEELLLEYSHTQQYHF